jgi:hypothetical protein
MQWEIMISGEPMMIPWNLYCYPVCTQHNYTTTHVDRKHMIFQVVVTNLETNIFKIPSTFHGPTIGNHDLEIIEITNIAISFLGNSTINEIMGATTIKKNDDLLMLDVTS